MRRNGRKGVHGIVGNEHIDIVARRVLNFRKHPDRLNAHPVVSGNRRGLPVVADQLLLLIGLRGIDAQFIILRCAAESAANAAGAKTAKASAPSSAALKMRLLKALRKFTARWVVVEEIQFVIADW